MRGQWDNYDGFNLVDLIDELKTRIEEPFRVDATLHGMIMASKDYYSLCNIIREFLKEDDER